MYTHMEQDSRTQSLIQTTGGNSISVAGGHLNVFYLQRNICTTYAVTKSQRQCVETGFSDEADVHDYIPACKFFLFIHS